MIREDNLLKAGQNVAFVSLPSFECVKFLHFLYEFSNHEYILIFGLAISFIITQH